MTSLRVARGVRGVLAIMVIALVVLITCGEYGRVLAQLRDWGQIPKLL
jgi:hypothetical protein